AGPPGQDRLVVAGAAVGTGPADGHRRAERTARAAERPRPAPGLQRRPALAADDGLPAGLRTRRRTRRSRTAGKPGQWAVGAGLRTGRGRADARAGRSRRGPGRRRRPRTTALARRFPGAGGFLWLVHAGHSGGARSRGHTVYGSL